MSPTTAGRPGGSASDRSSSEAAPWAARSRSRVTPTESSFAQRRTAFCSRAASASTAPVTAATTGTHRSSAKTPSSLLASTVPAPARPPTGAGRLRVAPAGSGRRHRGPHRRRGRRARNRRRWPNLGRAEPPSPPRDPATRSRRRGRPGGRSIATAGRGCRHGAPVSLERRRPSVASHADAGFGEVPEPRLPDLADRVLRLRRRPLSDDGRRTLLATCLSPEPEERSLREPEDRPGLVLCRRRQRARLHDRWRSPLASLVAAAGHQHLGDRDPRRAPLVARRLVRGALAGDAPPHIRRWSPLGGDRLPVCAELRGRHLFDADGRLRGRRNERLLPNSRRRYNVDVRLPARWLDAGLWRPRPLPAPPRPCSVRGRSPA
jgi:hypothetical protein